MRTEATLPDERTNAPYAERALGMLPLPRAGTGSARLIHSVPGNARLQCHRLLWWADGSLTRYIVDPLGYITMSWRYGEVTILDPGRPDRFLRQEGPVVSSSTSFAVPKVSGWSRPSGPCGAFVTWG